MKISRKGSSRDEGESSIELAAPRVRWDGEHGCIELSEASIGDFTGRSRHDYEITLSPVELGRILEELSAASGENASAVREGLAPYLRALLRLVGICVGPF